MPIGELKVSIGADLTKFYQDIRKLKLDSAAIDLGKALGGVTKLGGAGVSEAMKGGAASGFLKKIGEKMVITLGDITGILKKGFDKLADASPMLNATLGIMNKSMMLMLRPIGDILANFLRPLAIFFLKTAVKFYKDYAEGGFWSALSKNFLEIGEAIGASITLYATFKAADWAITNMGKWAWELLKSDLSKYFQTGAVGSGMGIMLGVGMAVAAYDIYDSLSKGDFRGAITSAIVLAGLGLMYVTPAGALVVGIGIALKWDKLFDGITTIGALIVTGFGTIVTTIAQMFTDLGSGIWDILTGEFEAGGKKLGAVTKNLLDPTANAAMWKEQWGKNWEKITGDTGLDKINNDYVGFTRTTNEAADATQVMTDKTGALKQATIENTTALTQGTNALWYQKNTVFELMTAKTAEIQVRVANTDVITKETQAINAQIDAANRAQSKGISSSQQSNLTKSGVTTGSGGPTGTTIGGVPLVYKGIQAGIDLGNGVTTGSYAEQSDAYKAMYSQAPQKMNDFIVTKSGQVIETHPDDVITGTKNGAGQGTSVGDVNITINAQTIDSKNVRDVARQLAELMQVEIRRRVSY